MLKQKPNDFCKRMCDGDFCFLLQKNFVLQIW